ncbi:phage tail terminator-like protein [uncultured Reyranella sp.]|jgi:hypothetical protein|uniref:phage tail terminator-like protein n=1 Tax=uncultured Reyranella sp. TaxID=735512 RepID=UPI00259D18D4|nr:phage tail terminator-like protein [uncultured Reyranella sp.]
MTIEESIEAALFGRVKSLDLSLAHAIAWPNVDFTKDSALGNAGAGWAMGDESPAFLIGNPDQPYIRVQHLPNVNTRLFMKGSNPHQRMGILQLTVVGKLLVGPTIGTRAAGEIAAHFPADLALYGEGVRVRITQSPTVAAAEKADTSWNVRVDVPYEAFA